MSEGEVLLWKSSWILMGQQHAQTISLDPVVDVVGTLSCDAATHLTRPWGQHAQACSLDPNVDIMDILSCTAPTPLGAAPPAPVALAASTQLRMLTPPSSYPCATRPATPPRT